MQWINEFILYVLITTMSMAYTCEPEWRPCPDLAMILPPHDSDVGNLTVLGPVFPQQINLPLI